MRKTLFPGGQFAPAKVVNLVRRWVVSLNRQEVVNLTVFCTEHPKRNNKDLTPGWGGHFSPVFPL
jgi:hypothetical protein